MAYTEPKTNWIAGDLPAASDFNRIEGNSKENHDDIVSEEATRLANDNTLQSNINSEAVTRLANDNALSARIDGITGSLAIGSYAFIAVNVPASTTYEYGTVLNGASIGMFLAGVSNSGITAGAAVSNQWRLCGRLSNSNAFTTSIASLFQRVS